MKGKEKIIGVLMTNLGSPAAASPKAVRTFLREFLSDPRVVTLPRILWLPILYGIILPFRSYRSAKLYRKIWTAEGSPLIHLTDKLKKALIANKQQNTNQQIIIEYAMRYGQPSLETAWQKLQAANVTHLIVLPLYPQYSATTTASTFDKLATLFKRERFIPALHFIQHYADHPLYIKALMNQCLKQITEHGKPDHWIFSFHGLPQAHFTAGDPYYCYCHKTSRLLAESLNLSPSEWTMTFQSRFGKAAWLQPYTDETLKMLPAQGKKHIAILCPGFPIDCLETLEEIHLQYKALFLQAGGERYYPIEALNDNEDHISLINALIHDVF